MLYTRHKTITTTTATSILTVPNGYVAYWNMLFVTNNGGSTNGVSVWFENNSVVQMYIVKDKQVSSKEYLLFDGNATFVLHEGDTIRAQLTGTGDMAIACTIDLLPAPTTFVNFNGS